MKNSQLTQALVQLASDALANPRDDVQLAKDVMNLLLSFGVDAALLSGYLTDADQRSADANVDIREEAKLRILEGEAEIAKAKP